MPNRYRQIAILATVILGCALLAGCATPASKEARFLRRGKSLLEKKDYSAASIEFRNAIQMMPLDAEAQYQLGLAYLAMGNTRDGASSLLKALELNPKHMGAQLRLASVMALQNDRGLVSDAAHRAGTIATDSLDNATALDVQALAEFRLGKVDQALQHMGDALKKSPGDLAAAINSSRILLQRNDTAGAEAILKKLVEAAPKSSQAALALGQLYFRLNRTGEAEAQIARAVELDPANAEALSVLGSWQLASKRPEQAAQSYKRIASIPGQQYKGA